MAVIEGFVQLVNVGQSLYYHTDDVYLLDDDDGCFYEYPFMAYAKLGYVDVDYVEQGLIVCP